MAEIDINYHNESDGLILLLREWQFESIYQKLKGKQYSFLFLISMCLCNHICMIITYNHTIAVLKKSFFFCT